MEITIDTHKDSRNDLRKLANFLLSLEDNGGGIRFNDRIGRKIEKNRNIFDDPNPSSMAQPQLEQPAMDAFAGMFGGSTPAEPENSGLKTFDVSSILKEGDNKEDVPRIIPY